MEFESLSYDMLTLPTFRLTSSTLPSILLRNREGFTVVVNLKQGESPVKVRRCAATVKTRCLSPNALFTESDAVANEHWSEAREGITSRFHVLLRR